MTVQLDDGERISLYAQVLKQVTGILPSIPIKISDQTKITEQRDKLADKRFNSPGEIDLLIGVELYEQLMLNEKQRIGKLTLTDSRVGWVVTGTGKIDISKARRQARKDPFVSLVTVDDSIRKFWEVNDIRDTSLLAKSPKNYTKEEKFVHDHFDQTTIQENGRFAVSLPFKKQRKVSLS